MITQEQIKELFIYDNGNLLWNKPNNKRMKPGNIAGSIGSHGYLQVKINGKLYLNHRIIFAMHNGFFPQFVDHIDCNQLNNSIENLRGATKQQNGCNRKLQKNNKSGVKGVSWHIPTNKWRAQLRLNGKTKHIGYYSNLHEAAIAIIEARKHNHGNFAKHF